MQTGIVVPLITVIVSAIGTAVIITGSIQRKWKFQGAPSLIIFTCAVMIWACADLLLYKTKTGGQLWLALSTLSATITATAILTFTLAYTGHREWVNKWVFIVLGLEPLATQVLFWNSHWHTYFDTGFIVRDKGIFLVSSPWYWINAAYSDGLMIFALILLSGTFFHKPKRYLLHYIPVIIAILIPIIATMINLAEVPLISPELPMISFAITGILLIYGFHRFNLLDIAPIAHEMVLESMGDGWIVLDANDRIVDLNRAAETFLEISREKIFGQPAETILPNWLKLDQVPTDRELETRASIKLQGKVSYLSVRILPLIRPPEKPIGRLLLWRDITEGKKLDNARQRAREEMFVFLHTISDIAFHTTTLNEFLTESISQIVYFFHSQAGLVYLLEDTSKRSAPKISLAAHHGIGRKEVEYLAVSPEVARIVTQIIQADELFYVPDISTDPRFPVPLQPAGIKCLLMLPLKTGEDVLGVIGLACREKTLAFGKEEITRLSIVAEELASFIRNDRIRQEAIAQEERLSLVRDLHDSIAQKLYSLVSLTEAAQASLETGTPVQATDISRIGERARQALKEMRLFLYQMKPVELESKGLVLALNERLAAVEGRANIKARVLVDENIQLSIEKEAILYNIAVEALNNVIKHTDARSVTVLLKRRKTSVILEVVDDGCGFDPKTADKGGMGLKIMQERVNKVDGKVTIRSAPGKGTKIIASVGENKVPPVILTKRSNEKNSFTYSR
ncbi:MAG: histidine kinase N-terminal 7TM domain-containing protein [Anaerolineales bacterium]